MKKKFARQPKVGYAAKIKSHIRMAIIEKYNVDMVDPTLFPNQKKKWQSFVDDLAKNGRIYIYIFPFFILCQFHENDIP